MNGLEIFVNLAVGLLVPIIVSNIKDRRWPDAWKLCLSLGVSIIVGAITTWVAGQVDGSPWTWNDFIASSGLVFSSATAFYKTTFQGTNFNRNILEPGGPFASTPTPPDPVVRGLEQAAQYARTHPEPDPHVLYINRDVPGNEVDRKIDLDESANPEHRSRIYPK